MIVAIRPAGLTAKQAAVLRFIASALDQSGGIGPTYKEIAAGVELISKSQVHRLIDALVLRGYVLPPLRQRARALALSSAGHEWWAQEKVASKAHGVAGDRMPPAPVCPACGTGWLHDRGSKIFRPNCQCEDTTARPASEAA